MLRFVFMCYDYEFNSVCGGGGVVGEEGGIGKIKQLFCQNELDRYELEI